MSEQVTQEKNPQSGQHADLVKNFLRASHEGDMDVVEKMLKQGVPADVSNSAGLQGIHFAAKGGNLEMIQLLLNSGASVNAQSLKGNSPLHAAALTGDSEVVKLLLGHGAKVNMTCECTEDVFTPLYMAAQIGHQEIVTLLLAHGADPLFKTSNGFTARDIAIQQGHKIVAELLDEYTTRLQSKTDLPPIDQNLHKSRKPVERLDPNISRNKKRLEKELILRGHLRAPAITKRDICPSPRCSPMRRNFESPCRK